LTTDCYGAGHDTFEIEVLKTIQWQQQQRKVQDISHVVGLEDTFQLTGPNRVHQALVMPKILGCSLHGQARRFPDRRIPVQIMKEITRQLLVRLAFLHNDCRVIHTDLHSKNICFDLRPDEVKRMAAGESADEVTPTITEEQPGNIRIIDFGVASYVDKHMTEIIQPEHLRAPEAFLGAPWGPSVDIWSLGCLVIEFVKGHVAFPGSASKKGTWTSEDDHLAQHMEVLGPMPAELLKRGTKTSQYFDEEGSLLRIPDLKLTSLERCIDGTRGILRRPHDMAAEEVPVFVDFLRGALTLDPDHRRSAKELLQHEWLRDVMSTTAADETGSDLAIRNHYDETKLEERGVESAVVTSALSEHGSKTHWTVDFFTEGGSLLTTHHVPR